MSPSGISNHSPGMFTEEGVKLTLINPFVAGFDGERSRCNLIHLSKLLKLLVADVTECSYIRLLTGSLH
jgi:hypothetical protein